MNNKLHCGQEVYFIRMNPTKAFEIEVGVVRGIRQYTLDGRFFYLVENRTYSDWYDEDALFTSKEDLIERINDEFTKF